MQLLRPGFRAMASPCEIQLWCGDRRAGEQAAAAAQAEVQRIERKYSRYRDDSVVAQINRGAGAAPLPVDAETAGLLDYAAAAWRQSDGRFDPTSGVLRRAWDFRTPRLPRQSELDALLPLVGWAQVEWQAPLLRLPRPGMELDFGGFGKEYAADRAAGVLAAHGIRHALVNLGGDLRVLGPQPDGRPWRIAIQHPRRPDGILAWIDLGSGGLATSGDYERYFELEGRRYCHLLDPRSGWPVAAPPRSVSVLAPLCLVAGTAATCAALQGIDGWRSLGDRPHLWLGADGVVRGSLAPAPAS